MDILGLCKRSKSIGLANTTSVSMSELVLSLFFLPSRMTQGVGLSPGPLSSRSVCTRVCCFSIFFSLGELTARCGIYVSSGADNERTNIYGKRERPKEAQNTTLSCLASAKGLAPCFSVFGFHNRREAICRVYVHKMYMYILLSTVLMLPASQGVEGVDCTNKYLNNITVP